MEATQARPTFVKDRKFPAWIGSLLFHVLVLLTVLLFLRLQPDPKGAPGEENASGGIVLRRQSDDGTSYVDEDNIFAEASPQTGEERPAAPTLEQALAGELSEADLNNVLPDASLGTRTAANRAQHVAGAAVLADNRFGGSRIPGLGFDAGGKKTLRVFNTPGEGRTFVFVFDRSGSMNEFGGKPLRAAKSELLKSIDSLDHLNQFNIIFYNNQSLPFRSGRNMPAATDATRESAKKFVEGMTALGGTAHFEPLREAIRHRPDVIFFLTDGDENDALSPGQLADVARINGRIGAGSQINVIQFGVGENRQSTYLRNLAAQNRGIYTYVNVAEFR